METLPGIDIILALYAVAWGAIWGSFLNVVIWRLPRGMSLSRPASHCPACKSPIRWHDNVPVVGWIMLRGRCRDCGTHISPRYPAVEALMAALSLGLWLHVAGDGRLVEGQIAVALMQFMLHFYFVFAMVAAAFIDLDLTIIPHRITFPAMAWGLLAGLLGAKAGVWAGYFPQVDVVDAALGLVAGGGVLFVVFYGYQLVRGIPGGGGGDITLLAAIGANLGWQALVFVLMAASLQGLLAAGVAAALGSKRTSAAESRGLLIEGAHTEAYWADHPIEGVAAHAEAAASQADAAAPSPQGSDDPSPIGEPAPVAANLGLSLALVAGVVGS